MTIYAQEPGLYLVTANAVSYSASNATMVLEVIGGQADSLWGYEHHLQTAHGVSIGSGYLIGASLAFHTYLDEGDPVESYVNVTDYSNLRENLTVQWCAPAVNEPEVPT